MVIAIKSIAKTRKKTKFADKAPKGLFVTTYFDDFVRALLIK